MKKKKKKYAKTPLSVTILLSLVGVLVFVVAILVNKPDSVLWEVIKSIGFELAISSIVVLVTYLVLGERTNQAVSNDAFRDTILETINEVQGERSELLPYKVFTSSENLPYSYLSFLYKSFLSTQTYIIFADRVVNLLRRLKTLLEQESSLSPNQIVQTKRMVILLPNYFDKTLMGNLKKIATLRERNENQGEKNILVKECLDVLRTLYVLKKLDEIDQINDRLNLEFEVYFYKDYPFARMEIMDDCALLSIMPIEGKIMTSTIVYEKGSTFYQTYLNYVKTVMARSINISQMTNDPNVNSIADLSDEFFVTSLKSIAAEYSALSDKKIIQKFEGWYQDVTPFDIDINKLSGESD